MNIITLNNEWFSMQVDFDGYTYILLDFPNVITGIKVVFYGLEM